MSNQAQYEAHAMLDLARTTSRRLPLLDDDGVPTAHWYYVHILELAVLAADTLVLLAEVLPTTDHRFGELVALDIRMNRLCTEMADMLDARVDMP